MNVLSVLTHVKLCLLIHVSGFSGWSYSSGFVTCDMIRDNLPAPSSDVLIVLCGPPAMIQNACLPNLDKLGHKKENVFAY